MVCLVSGKQSEPRKSKKSKGEQILGKKIHRVQMGESSLGTKGPKNGASEIQKSNKSDVDNHEELRETMGLSQKRGNPKNGWFLLISLQNQPKRDPPKKKVQPKANENLVLNRSTQIHGHIYPGFVCVSCIDTLPEWIGPKKSKLLSATKLVCPKSKKWRNLGSESKRTRKP